MPYLQSGVLKPCLPWQPQHTWEWYMGGYHCWAAWCKTYGPILWALYNSSHAHQILSLSQLRPTPSLMTCAHPYPPDPPPLLTCASKVDGLIPRRYIGEHWWTGGLPRGEQRILRLIAPLTIVCNAHSIGTAACYGLARSRIGLLVKLFSRVNTRKLGSNIMI